MTFHLKVLSSGVTGMPCLHLSQTLKIAFGLKLTVLEAMMPAGHGWRIEHGMDMGSFVCQKMGNL